jgi:hypothetical protein
MKKLCAEKMCMVQVISHQSGFMNQRHAYACNGLGRLHVVLEPGEEVDHRGLCPHDVHERAFADCLVWGTCAHVLDRKDTHILENRGLDHAESSRSCV